jgi:hypothetical protein
MHQEQSGSRKYLIHEKALPASDPVCCYEKLGDTRNRNQSLFSLLLEIESRLRKKARDVRIEQLRRSKEKDHQRSRVNNLSRLFASSRDY